jgi:hypothetical protein
MTRDDIILLAREAGWTIGPVWAKRLERFAVAVAEHEREACAKLAMTISEQGLPKEMPEGDELLRACEQIASGVLIADAIRARGQE